MPTVFHERARQNIANIAKQHLTRQLHARESDTGIEQIIDGKTYINFSSNDYLGLAHHPKVIASVQSSVTEYGVGSGASRYINGHTKAHQQLTEALCDFLDREVILFNSGFSANFAVFQSLFEAGDHVYLDKEIHASSMDAVRAHDIRWHRYRHGDLNHLNQLLQKVSGVPQCIATESVFSMSGDVAALPELVKMARAYQALLFVDDAHGFGVLGEQGRGALSHFKLGINDVPLVMATFGKALGTCGAFVAADSIIIDQLVQTARSNMYTTALPPALAAATLASLQCMMNEPEHQQKLQHNIEYFRQCISRSDQKFIDSCTPIQALLLDSIEATMHVVEQLKDQGFWVAGIRPPTVPKDSPRIRITLNAGHTKAQIDRLFEAIQSLKPEYQSADTVGTSS